jgi:hypothetical protein
MKLVRVKPYNYFVIHFMSICAVVGGYIWCLMTINSDCLDDEGALLG